MQGSCRDREESNNRDELTELIGVGFERLS